MLPNYDLCAQMRGSSQNPLHWRQSTEFRRSLIGIGESGELKESRYNTIENSLDIQAEPDDVVSRGFEEILLEDGFCIIDEIKIGQGGKFDPRAVHSVPDHDDSGCVYTGRIDVITSVGVATVSDYGSQVILTARRKRGWGNNVTSRGVHKEDEGCSPVIAGYGVGANSDVIRHATYEQRNALVQRGRNRNESSTSTTYVNYELETAKDGLSSVAPLQRNKPRYLYSKLLSWPRATKSNTWG